MAHSTLPVLSVVQAGAPITVPPIFTQPSQAAPLNWFVHSALSIVPVTPQIICPAVINPQLVFELTKPPSDPQPAQPAALHVPPLNRLDHSAVSVPLAKQTTCPLTPSLVHVGCEVACPPILRNVLQVVPLKRLTNTALVVARAAQMAPPALSLVQLGPEVVVAVTLAKVLQAVPLKTVEVSPPVTLRAAHSTFPALSGAQLGAEVSCPPTDVSGLQVVPLKTVANKALVVPLAAQTILPAPLSVQLGSEVITPVRLCQPAQVVPLN